jgi:NAD(P)-dependent dehydrogenase (short-subunit alcohol dehydrogenase family)
VLEATLKRSTGGGDLSGVFYCLRYEIPALLIAGGGSIVCMSSVLGSNGFPQQVAYTAAKHGVVGLTKSAALEYASQGIRVKAVAPGFVETPLLTEGLTPLRRRALVRAQPIGRSAGSVPPARSPSWSRSCSPTTPRSSPAATTSSTADTRRTEARSTGKLTRPTV